MLVSAVERHSMADDLTKPNVYGENHPASDAKDEASIRDEFSPEQIDARDLLKLKKEQEEDGEEGEVESTVDSGS
jgi:hypothetical protein